jgi:hypothetical protein
MIEDLPLNGHSPLEMYARAAGVVASDRYPDTGLIDQQTFNAFITNGAPVATADTGIEGVPDLVDLNRGSLGGSSYSPHVSLYIPSAEAIIEFKLQTSTLPVEYGHTSGSVRNVVVKPGTNQVHGSAMEVPRNSVFDANGFFANVAGQKLPPDMTNVFGGTVGGPVYLPRMYDGMNRTFFFASYEHLSNPPANTGLVSVATPKMWTDDFSELSTSIYNPYSTHYLPVHYSSCILRPAAWERDRTTRLWGSCGALRARLFFWRAIHEPVS